MTEENELRHYQGVQCPECNKLIMIVLGTPEAITMEEAKKRSQEQVKKWREEEKRKAKA